jgi:hypothetical protein
MRLSWIILGCCLCNGVRLGSFTDLVVAVGLMES